jgi:hypothetical protein
MTQKCLPLEIIQTEFAFLKEITNLETQEILLNGSSVERFNPMKSKSLESVLENLLMRMSKIKFDCFLLVKIEDSMSMTLKNLQKIKDLKLSIATRSSERILQLLVFGIQKQIQKKICF